jgi:hypothetical protein
MGVEGLAAEEVVPCPALVLVLGLVGEIPEEAGRVCLAWLGVLIVVSIWEAVGEWI